MTLSPVFRSPEAVNLLRSEGVWDRLQLAASGQAAAVARVCADLDQVLDSRFIRQSKSQALEPDTDAWLRFMQEFFFLILFCSVLDSLGVGRKGLELYCEANFCIRGTITAADDLFDDQDRSLLPLDLEGGPRFRAILRLLSFQSLLARSFNRAIAAGVLTESESDRVQQELLSRMAVIGTLEGVEEGGVEVLLDPDRMTERVHRVRGGALFELAFVAPRRVERGSVREKIGEAAAAIARLGTAFQIVDDLTDFEVDLRRCRNNLLVAQIHHAGGLGERKALRRIRQAGAAPERVLERWFLASARAVFDRAHAEARAGLEGLRRLGFWLDPDLAEPLVRAIVGLDSASRMRAIGSAT